MAVTVFIPSPLRQFADGRYEVQVEGRTVEAALANLVAGHPKLKENLLAGDGQLQPFVHVFVDSKDIRSRQGLATPLADGSELLIVQAISGG